MATMVMGWVYQSELLLVGKFGLELMVGDGGKLSEGLELIEGGGDAE